jgi:hypothetical protein
MLASQRYNHKIINAYTGNTPGEFTPFWKHLDEESRNYWLSQFEKSFDTLYIIKSANKYETVTWNEISKTSSFNRKNKN